MIVCVRGSFKQNAKSDYFGYRQHFQTPNPFSVRQKEMETKQKKKNFDPKLIQKSKKKKCFCKIAHSQQCEHFFFFFNENIQVAILISFKMGK